MNAPVDELYFQWLYSQIGDVKLKAPASKTYWKLAAQLHSKEFLWLVLNDDNRVADGRDLRQFFLEDTGVTPDENWLGLGCSFLEMFVALSHRLAFEDGMAADRWFWRMMDNLDLEVYTDRYYGDEAPEVIDEILERVLWRRFEPDGMGGIFPLEHPREDQRQVEIWYQACAYLAENE